MNFRLISILALGVAAAAAHAISFTADFDGITAGTALTNQYAADGVTFTGADVVVGSPSAISGLNVAKATGTTITGTLSKYADTVSFYYYKTTSSDLEFTAYDSYGDEIGFNSVNYKNGWFTMGVGPGDQISSFTITGDSGSFQIDDLTLEPVPEPASMAALGVGLLALRRRKKS
jgi:hypothetical protein